MTRSQKMVFIGLGMLLLLFVALVIWGNQRPDCQAGGGKEGQENCTSEYTPGKGMKALGKLFGSAGTRIKLDEKTYTLDAGGRRELAIPAGKSDALRTLKLRLAQGTRAELSMANRDRSESLNLSDQEKPTALPRDAKDEDDRRSLSFAVTKGGGTLTLSCPSQTPCVIEVE